MLDVLISLLIPCLPASVANWALWVGFRAPAGTLHGRARWVFLLAFLVPAILGFMIDVRLVFWVFKALGRDGESAAMLELFVTVAALLSPSLFVMLPLVSWTKRRLTRRDIPWIAVVILGTVFYLGFQLQVVSSFVLGYGLRIYSVIAGIAIVIGILTMPRDVPPPSPQVGDSSPAPPL